MSVYSPVYHAMISSPGPAGGTEAVTVSANKADGASKTDDAGESFFHHMLDVINPLQHLPVVGTIYRAITGEHIGAVEKIAGDTLYGGLWGAVSSIADVAFEGITGKSFEDTAMAWIKGDDKTQVANVKVGVREMALNMPALSADMPALPSQDVAAATPSATMPAATMPAAAGPDIAALTSALSSKGVDNDTASRALYAYRRSMGMTAQPVFASVN
jgi:hypothetical protein